jgi:hypothetical protein
VIAVFQKKKIAIDHVLSRFVKGDGRITSEEVIEAQKSLPEYVKEQNMTMQRVLKDQTLYLELMECRLLSKELIKINALSLIGTFF